MKIKKFVAVLAIILFVLTYNIHIYATTEAEVNQLKEQKANEEQQLNTIKEEKDTETTALDEINNKIKSLNDEISVLTVRLEELNSNIQAKQEEIANKEKDIAQKQELLKKRLVVMYKRGSTSYLDVLLGSSNYIDMIANYDAIKDIADKDTSLINEVAEQKRNIENEKKDLEAKQEEVALAKQEKDGKNLQLQVMQKEKETKVASLTEDEKAKQEEIEATDAKIRAAEEEMARIWQQIQEQQRARAAESARASSYEDNDNNEDEDEYYSDDDYSSSDGLNFDGSFIWPCDNMYVTSRMKWRWGRLHKGIDIGADYENVYASASGYCYNAYDSGGYGNYIMIFHGSGYVTLYGHLNYSMVSDGQYVSQGEVIAESGNTGGSTGPHLHFEIRQAYSVGDFFNKDPLDPLDYLPGGYIMYD